MKFYFVLLSKRISRYLDDNGIEPWVGYVLAVSVFVLVSDYVIGLGYGSYVYIFLASIPLLVSIGVNRNDFLKLCFSKQQYRWIRLIENYISIFPFVLFLCYKLYFIEAVVVMFLSFLLSFVSFGIKKNLILPTPFYRFPFEFAVGFRKTWMAIFVCYLLTGISIWADNFNIGVFSVGVLILICVGYYSKSEPLTYVKIYNCNSAVFLKKKCEIAVLYCSMLIFLPVLVLLFFNFNQLFMLSVIVMSGFCYLVLAIFGKYACYPSEIAIFQGVVFFLAIWFPPMLIILLPYTYKKASKNLMPILK